MENTFGTMGLCMKVHGTKIKLMAQVFMCGLMVENTTVNGLIITCTVKVSTHGKMEEDMMANMKTIVSTDMVSTPGMTASNMKGGGAMENNTEKVHIEKMVVTVEESGKTVNVSNGLMTMAQII